MPNDVNWLAEIFSLRALIDFRTQAISLMLVVSFFCFAITRSCLIFSTCSSNVLSDCDTSGVTVLGSSSSSVPVFCVGVGLNSGSEPSGSSSSCPNSCAGIVGLVVVILGSNSSSLVSVPEFFGICHGIYSEFHISAGCELLVSGGVVGPLTLPWRFSVI